MRELTDEEKQAEADSWKRWDKEWGNTESGAHTFGWISGRDWHAARATDRTAELEAMRTELSNLKDEYQDMADEASCRKGDYLAAIAQADDWHRQYMAERERRVALQETVEEIEQRSLIQGRRAGIWKCPWCMVDSTLRRGIHHTEGCVFAALSGSSAAPAREED
jgi:hypothetical protein